ncbi:hypothetical protein LK542_13295 [Massilia sp. IC2-477]|uniref:hypothetical protein n=1 Tax=unclassified Massilia TaxID=2609279 RepID=UPI001D121D8B|nr:MULTISPECIES: hypothetical protein [unclassified Massilia]MCC2956589.1 hypothetical protein [Massilia sp. IC2-477]MCC2971163.1 hypothetical protein [Massilia sp. IC2-476]
MRSIYPLVAAACLLAAPLASAAQCGPGGKVNVTAQRATVAGPNGFIATGAQLASEVEGSYALSNGRRLELIDLDQQVYADFGKWSRVRLDEVGPHRFASREGDVQMTWLPGERTDTIVLSYPADSRGRFKRGCS